MYRAGGLIDTVSARKTSPIPPARIAVIAAPTTGQSPAGDPPQQQPYPARQAATHGTNQPQTKRADNRHGPPAGRAVPRPTSDRIVRDPKLSIQPTGRHPQEPHIRQNFSDPNPARLTTTNP